METFYITTIILILLAIFLLMSQFIRSKIAREKKLREELKSISEFAADYFCEHQILQFQCSSYRQEIEDLKKELEKAREDNIQGIIYKHTGSVSFGPSTRPNNPNIHNLC